MARLRPLTKDEVSPKVAARLEAAALENYRARFNRAFLVESQHFYKPERG